MDIFTSIKDAKIVQIYRHDRSLLAMGYVQNSRSGCEYASRSGCKYASRGQDVSMHPLMDVLLVHFTCTHVSHIRSSHTYAHKICHVTSTNNSYLLIINITIYI